MNFFRKKHKYETQSDLQNLSVEEIIRIDPKDIGFYIEEETGSNPLTGDKLKALNKLLAFTPFLISNAHFTGQKNKKKHKINSRNFTYDGLTFSSYVFILEEVKDGICKAKGEPVEKHNSRSCLSIQQLVNFIMFIEEFASRVLNTIFLFSQLTQLEHTNRRNTLLFSLSL